MESEQTTNRQRRVFIIALGKPRMPHARLPGGIIDRSQHCDACSSRKVADVTATEPWQIHHWMAVPIIPAARGYE